MFIYIKSKKSKQRIIIGEIDFARKTALFYINEARLFQKADCVGIDQNVFDRSDMNLIDDIIFKLWDGRKYQLTKFEFTQNSWLYPTKEDGVAPESVFEPKRIISIERIEDIIKSRKPLSDREQYLISQGLTL